MKQKFLKIKIGEVFIDKKSYSVFKTAFQKQSKKGGTYYEIREPIFVQEYEPKEKIEKQSNIDA